MAIRRLIACIGVGVVLMMVVVLCWPSSSSSSHVVSFEKKERVFDETLFLFHPTMTQDGAQSVLTVDVTITSYMYPSILALDMQSHWLLEVGSDHVVSPHAWVMLDTTPHQLRGELLFYVPQGVTLDTFSLKVFALSDHDVVWD